MVLAISCPAPKRSEIVVGPYCCDEDQLRKVVLSEVPDPVVAGEIGLKIHDSGVAVYRPLHLGWVHRSLLEGHLRLLFNGEGEDLTGGPEAQGRGVVSPPGQRAP